MNIEGASKFFETALYYNSFHSFTLTFTEVPILMFQFFGTQSPLVKCSNSYRSRRQ
jgi:hypothetical protein